VSRIIILAEAVTVRGSSAILALAEASVGAATDIGGKGIPAQDDHRVSTWNPISDDDARHLLLAYYHPDALARVANRDA
jgi:hypothetical protein